MHGWLIAPYPATQPSQVPQVPINEEHKNRFTTLLFESHSGYDRLSKIEEPAKILTGLNAKEIYEPARLNRIMNLVSSAGVTHQLRSSNSPDLFRFYGMLEGLSNMEITSKVLLHDEKIGKVPATDSILELEVADYGDDGIEPVRMEAVFRILRDLEMNISILLRSPDHHIVVKYLDSGCKFTIGLEGLKEPIEALGTMLERFWDKRRFRDQDTFEKDMEALSKGIDLLAKTQEAVQAGTMTAEEAANLKTRVLRRANDLIGLGVTLPLGGATAEEERKQLKEKRSTKLLTAGSLDDDAPAAPVAPAPQPNPAAGGGD